MPIESDLEAFLDHLCPAVGYSRRHVSLCDYCKGVMLHLERKSVEPIAAAIEPDNVRSKHQSLHHFVADAAWSDTAVLGKVHRSLGYCPCCCRLTQ